MSIDWESIAQIAGAVATVLAGREAIGMAIRRYSRKGNGVEPEDQRLARINREWNETTDPNLRPVTQGECGLTRNALMGKLDEQGRRLEGHGKQLRALDDSMSGMKVTLTEIGGDIKEMRAGMPGQIQSAVRHEMKDHERSPFHVNRRASK